MPPTPACIEVGDIYRTYPAGATDDEKAQIDSDNADHRKLYFALVYLLRQDFDFQGLPDKPENFCSNNTSGLSSGDQARYAAIHGLMLADNWTDPSLGKTDATEGDQSIVDPDGNTLIIAKRFADVVVEAVQEYTQRSVLFQKVFGFLQNEAMAAGNNSTPYQVPSPPAAGGKTTPTPNAG